MRKLIDKMSICIYNIKNENIHFIGVYNNGKQIYSVDGQKRKRRDSFARFACYALGYVGRQDYGRTVREPAPARRLLREREYRRDCSIVAFEHNQRRIAAPCRRTGR